MGSAFDFSDVSAKVGAKVSYLQFTRNNKFLVFGMTNGNILIYLISYCYVCKHILTDNFDVDNSNITTLRGFNSVIGDVEKSPTLNDDDIDFNTDL
jgi:hypothetical protein